MQALTLQKLLNDMLHHKRLNQERGRHENQEMGCPAQEMLENQSKLEQMDSRMETSRNNKMKLNEMSKIKY